MRESITFPAGRRPAFVIYNTGKSGSHFLTQTLTNLGFPVAFEYGLRLNSSTEEKTSNALRMYQEEVEGSPMLIFNMEMSRRQYKVVPQIGRILCMVYPSRVHRRH